MSSFSLPLNGAQAVHSAQPWFRHTAFKASRPAMPSLAWPYAISQRSTARTIVHLQVACAILRARDRLREGGGAAASLTPRMAGSGPRARPELVAGRGASDHTAHQPAPTDGQRRKHVLAVIATPVGFGRLLVARCLFREPPDLHPSMVSIRRLGSRRDRRTLVPTARPSGSVGADGLRSLGGERPSHGTVHLPLQ